MQTGAGAGVELARTVTRLADIVGTEVGLDVWVGADVEVGCGTSVAVGEAVRVGTGVRVGAGVKKPVPDSIIPAKAMANKQKPNIATFFGLSQAGLATG